MHTYIHTSSHSTGSVRRKSTGFKEQKTAADDVYKEEANRKLVQVPLMYVHMYVCMQVNSSNLCQSIQLYAFVYIPVSLYCLRYLSVCFFNSSVLNNNSLFFASNSAQRCYKSIVKYFGILKLWYFGILITDRNIIR